MDNPISSMLCNEKNGDLHPFCLDLHDLQPNDIVLLRYFSRPKEGSDDSARVMELLKKRVTRQENLLLKCKELLRNHKERSAQLGSENETLQEQLQLRLQELEKMKV